MLILNLCGSPGVPWSKHFRIAHMDRHINMLDCQSPSTNQNSVINELIIMNVEWLAMDLAIQLFCLESNNRDK
jgi:hypothetical protein